MTANRTAEETEGHMEPLVGGDISPKHSRDVLEREHRREREEQAEKDELADLERDLGGRKL